MSEQHPDREQHPDAEKPVTDSNIEQAESAPPASEPAVLGQPAPEPAAQPETFALQKYEQPPKEANRSWKATILSVAAGVGTGALSLSLVGLALGVVAGAFSGWDWYYQAFLADVVEAGQGSGVFLLVMIPAFVITMAVFLIGGAIIGGIGGLLVGALLGALAGFGTDRLLKRRTNRSRSS